MTQMDPGVRRVDTVRTTVRTLLVAITALFVGSAPLAAQVGTVPQASPFRDLEKRMELSFFSGYFLAGKDPVGVAPQSGPMAGARYEFKMGSLISATARTGLVITKRTVIDPSQPAATRVVGETDQGVFLFDVGLGLNLTGNRSFHNFVPVLSVGLGMSSDFQQRDAGDFALTPRLLATFGAGIKWLAGESFQVRLDATDYLLGVSYPTTYMLPASDGTRARQGDESVYTSNLGVSLGISYRFYR